MTLFYANTAISYSVDSRLERISQNRFTQTLETKRNERTEILRKNTRKMMYKLAYKSSLSSPYQL